VTDIHVLRVIVTEIPVIRVVRFIRVLQVIVRDTPSYR